MLKQDHMRLHRLVLFAGDSLLLLLAAFLGAMLWQGQPVDVLRVHTGATLIFLSLFLLSFYLLDLFDLQTVATTRALPWMVTLACGVAALMTGTGFYLAPTHSYERATFVVADLLMIPFAIGWRRVLTWRWRSVYRPVPTVVVGEGERAAAVRDCLNRHHASLQFVGVISPREETITELDDESTSIVVLGNLGALEEILNRHQIGCVVITGEIPPEFVDALMRLRFRGVSVRRDIECAKCVTDRLPLELLGDSWLWLADRPGVHRSLVLQRLKRLIDLILAVPGLLVALPIGVLIALAIKLDSPGSVFDRQPRVGRGQQPFELLKFRSTLRGAQSPLPASSPSFAGLRVTRIGRILRALHLDGIPQIINIVRGEMSFVGPRPQRVQRAQELQHASPYSCLRSQVSPGLTGWAQVRCSADGVADEWRRELEFDLYYVLHASPLFDLRIMLRTLQIVVQGH